MGRNFTPKSLLYTTGAPAPTPSVANPQTQAPAGAEARPTVSEQERRKRRRAEASVNLIVSGAGQSSLSTEGSDTRDRSEQNQTEQPPTVDPNDDNIPWNPRLTYCGHQLTRTDSIRDTPAFSLALLKAVELPKDMARVEKEGGDAFVRVTQHMFSVSDLHFK